VQSIGRRETVAIGVVAMILVIVAGWFLLIKPTSAKVASLKKQTQQQQQDNDAVRTQISVLQADKKKLPQEAAELATLAQRVPPSVQLPTLLREMQQLAKDAGVELKGITPTQPAPLTGAQGIDAVGITLIVSGGYAEIEQLDTGLESLSRAFLVSGLALSSGSGSQGSQPGSASSSSTSTSDSSGGLITATFTGRILLRAPGSQTPAG
jgi:Tfp pilus assembly protein PilO